MERDRRKESEQEGTGGGCIPVTEEKVKTEKRIVMS